MWNTNIILSTFATSSKKEDNTLSNDQYPSCFLPRPKLSRDRVDQFEGGKVGNKPIGSPWTRQRMQAWANRSSRDAAGIISINIESDMKSRGRSSGYPQNNHCKFQSSNFISFRKKPARSSALRSFNKQYIVDRSTAMIFLPSSKLSRDWVGRA